MLSEPEIKQLADAVLTATLTDAGFDRSRILLGTDIGGEPTISVVARFKPGVGAPDGKSAVAAISALRRALEETGEERASVLRYEFPDDDVPGIDPVEFSALEP